MKIKLESLDLGTYNTHFAYARLTSDNKRFKNHSFEDVQNWNTHVLGLLKGSFSSNLCKLNKFGFEDQGFPVSLEIELFVQGGDALEHIERQLNQSVKKVNDVIEYRSKLRFYKEGDSQEHGLDESSSEQYRLTP